MIDVYYYSIHERATNQPVENQAAFIIKHSNAMRGQRSGGCISSSYCRSATDGSYNQQRNAGSRSDSCCDEASSTANLEVAERKECFIKRQSTCGEGEQSKSQSNRCKVDVCGKFTVAAVVAKRAVAAYGNSQPVTDEIKFYKKRPTSNQWRLW